MKSNFYYKEEFPLKLEIDFENMQELSLFLGIFFNQARDHKNIESWTDYMIFRSGGGNSEEIALVNKAGTMIKESSEDTRTEIHKNLTDTYLKIKEVWEKHEGRNVLQGNVSEGVPDTHS